MAISCIIPTRHRAEALRRMFETFARSMRQPDEILVIDASDADQRGTEDVCRNPPAGMTSELRYLPAVQRGAAVQRIQGLEAARHDLLLFSDDDVLVQPDCLERMERAMLDDPRLGAVNALMTNQKYHPPGRFSRIMFRFLNGGPLPTYAGKVLGPGVKLDPSDDPSLPEVVPVDWLGIGYTLYRREALPTPLFPPVFKGASWGEDFHLSVMIANKGWRLANIRLAQLIHDSQPGDHKRSYRIKARQGLYNELYIMHHALGRRGLKMYAKRAVWEFFVLAALAGQGPQGWRALPGNIIGRIEAVIAVIRGKEPA